MIQTIINTVLGITVLALGYLALLPGGGAVGTSMYERTKWIGEVFSVGSSEQLTVDSSGNLQTTGTYGGNSVTLSDKRQAMASATTTVCAIQSPAATTTLEMGAANFTVSSTTASTLTIAKAATAYATTTLIRTASMGANSTETVFTASTTVSALTQTNQLFAPSQWLVFGMAGGTGTFSPSGTCTATFRSVI